MFNSRLQPLVATVAIELRVATADPGSEVPARLASAYAGAQEALASLVPMGMLASLGIDAPA
jgi:hypothetical protein